MPLFGTPSRVHSPSPGVMLKDGFSMSDRNGPLILRGGPEKGGWRGRSFFMGETHRREIRA